MSETPIDRLDKTEAESELVRLVRILQDADIAYYQKDTPVLEDRQYDDLRRRLNALVQRFPNLHEAADYQSTVGAMPGSGFA